MKPTADRLVDEYLRRLDRELSGLPRARRRELVGEIAGHIAEARAELAAETEAGIRNLLERLGDPVEIAAEERARTGVQPRRAGWTEILALILLPIGGVVLPVLGWFVGVVLLWVSDAWTTREKLVGTLVIPGGLATPLFLGGLALDVQAPDVLGPLLAVVLLLAPLVTTVFLARRMKRPRSVAYQPSSGAA
jgi:hypothetical protein